MNRREALKVMGCAVLGATYWPQREPIAYIVMHDTFDCDLKPGNPSVKLDPNYVNRAWHVYWAHHPGAKEKFEKAKVDYRKPWYRNTKEIIVYDLDDFPEWVRRGVDKMRDYDQFHSFKGYSLVPDRRGFPKYDAGTVE